MEELNFNWINEQEEIDYITPRELDAMLAEGWRHFGSLFFRYNLNLHENQLCLVLPLRVNLTNYKNSKSFKKILKKNRRFRLEINPACINEETLGLFEHHKTKFNENTPESIYDFLDKNASSKPCETKEIRVYDGLKLIAQSFYDIGLDSISSIYGMYDLKYSSYSLGLFTMLIEIEDAIRRKKKFYYHGYCYNVPSFYDYKKRFPNVECYHWQKSWVPLKKEV